MNKIIIFILALTFISCTAEKKQGQLISLTQLEEIIAQDKEEVLIINFWATWCKPCIAEMPEFEKINNDYDKVRVLFVSIDFPEEVESRVLPFLEKKQLKSEVVILDESDQNLFINTIEDSWSGAIPASLILQNKKKFRTFHEGQLTYEELESIIKPIL
ncbi:MAG: thiol-disulfide isomerase/thioredoxin [Sphingobacteriales bacterium]|jgi:thiol-disulfide isomerase/thioredoxin